ncbi:hypothetical protein Tco_0668330 [Tanacetum coccineum]
MSEIRELHAADRRRQAVISDMLKAGHKRSAEMRELRTADHTRQQQVIQTLIVMQSLQGQVTTLQGQGLVKRSHTGDLNLYALNATITTTVRVLQNATNATKLAILLVTVGVREMPTMLTIRGALGQARNLLDSSVEFKDTSRGNVQR